MIDLNNYTTKKAKGLFTITGIAKDKVLVTAKVFDPQTGEELDPHARPFTIEEIDQKIAQVQSDLAQLTDFRSDILKENAKLTPIK